MPRRLEKLTHVFPICSQAFKTKQENNLKVEVLNRKIQKQAGGHDSNEGALAILDLIRVCQTIGYLSILMLVLLNKGYCSVKE